MYGDVQGLFELPCIEAMVDKKYFFMWYHFVDDLKLEHFITESLLY